MSSRIDGLIKQQKNPPIKPITKSPRVNSVFGVVAVQNAAKQPPPSSNSPASPRGEHRIFTPNVPGTRKPAPSKFSNSPKTRQISRNLPGTTRSRTPPAGVFPPKKPWMNQSVNMRSVIERHGNEAQEGSNSNVHHRHRLQRHYNHEGATGNVCKWSVSGDMPAWVIDASRDKSSIIKPLELTRGKDLVNHFEHEGYDGHVTDWSVSGDNPDFILKRNQVFWNLFSE